MEWLAPYHSVHGADPTEHQIVDWYRSKPDGYFDEVGKNAYRWFYTFANILLSDKIDGIKQLAIKEAVGNIIKFGLSSG